MKIHVCFTNYAYEGNSDPEAAFLDEEKAKQWVKDNKPRSRSAQAEYVTLEVIE